MAGREDFMKYFESEVDFLKAMLASVEKTNACFTIVDVKKKDMPLVYVNKAFEKMTGYSRSDCLGINCRFLQGKDTNKSAVDKIRAAIKAETSIKVLIKNFRKNGEMFWNELLMSPIKIKGELKYFVGVQQDVTARVGYKKQVEEEKRKLETLNKVLLDRQDKIDQLQAEIKKLKGIN